jgi:hypothetical protein
MANDLDFFLKQWHYVQQVGKKMTAPLFLPYPNN